MSAATGTNDMPEILFPVGEDRLVWEHFGKESSGVFS